MPQTDVFLPEDQFWVLVVGAIVPVAGYFQNKVWPNAPEPAKAIFQAVLAGVAGALFTVFINDVTAAGDVAQHVWSSIISALFAHNILWKPANVNIRIGARPSPTQTPVVTRPQDAPAAIPGAGAAVAPRA